MKNKLSRRKINQYFAQSILGISGITAGASSASIFAQSQQPLKFRVAGRLPRAGQTSEGWEGFEVDMGSTLSAQSSLPVEYIKSFNWKRSLASLQDGSLDLMASVSFREERLSFMDYIGPLDIENAYLIVREDQSDFTLNTIDDFTNFPGQIQNNFTAAWDKEFGDRLTNDADFSTHFLNLTGSAFNDHAAFIDSTALRIRQNRIFGAILDYYSASEVVNTEHPEARLEFGDVPLKMVRISLFGTPSTHLVASRLLDANVRSALKAAYLESRSNGSFSANWQKWYTDRPEPPVEDALFVQNAG